MLEQLTIPEMHPITPISSSNPISYNLVKNKPVKIKQTNIIPERILPPHADPKKERGRPRLMKMWNGPMGSKTLDKYGQIDHKKVIELSRDDFADWHLEKMIEYEVYNDYWSTKDNIPKCSSCLEEISGPKEMVRYYGNAIHKTCFPDYFNKEEFKAKGTLLKYWNKIVNELCE